MGSMIINVYEMKARVSFSCSQLMRWRGLGALFLCAMMAVVLSLALWTAPAQAFLSMQPKVDNNEWFGAWVNVDDLPLEARQTLRLIASGGPYPFRRDGVVFHNREKILPQNPRGYYREYTVPTPGINHRGARRIISGGRGQAYYYTADHYRSFKRILKNEVR